MVKGAIEGVGGTSELIPLCAFVDIWCVCVCVCVCVGGGGLCVYVCVYVCMYMCVHVYIMCVVFMFACVRLSSRLPVKCPFFRI